MKTLAFLLRLSVCGWVMLATVAPAHAADRRRNNGPTKASAAKAAAKAPAASAVSPAQSIEAFQIVLEKNIFNPNRVGRTRVSAEEKALRVDEVALVGTIQYDDKNLAIFDSRDSAYRKAVRVGETCGEFKVQRVAPDRVELTNGEKKFSLKVAQQLRRVEGGEWKVGAVPPRVVETRPGTPPTGSVSPGRSLPPPPPVVEIPANASEVLKRLMKAREQQLKK